MLTLEIYSYVLEIPIDAYTALSQLAVQHSVKSTANWLVDVGKYWEGNFEHYYTTVFCVQKWFIKAEHWGTFIEMSQKLKHAIIMRHSKLMVMYKHVDILEHVHAADVIWRQSFFPKDYSSMSKKNQKAPIHKPQTL